MALLGKVAKALEGLPRKVEIPRLGVSIEAGPSQEIRDVAEQYMRDAGLRYDPITKYAKINEDRARRIAAAFDEMKDDPSDPATRKAYEAMAKETLAQWQAIKKYGNLNVDFIDTAKGDPYAASPRLAIEDITKNNQMKVFATDDGYGAGGITDEMIAANPMLNMTDELINGRPARVNDIFRVVHDYFGHAKEGVGFRAGGEENAWRGHGSMYSGDALPAATSETRGQNSWLNYGPFGEQNRNASSEATRYADQKIGLLPKWAWMEGLKDKDLAALLAIMGAGGGAAAGGGLLGRLQKYPQGNA